MGKPENRGYSEPVRMAGQAFDTYQKLEESQRDLAKQLETVQKTRIRTKNPEKLESLRVQSEWLSKEIAALEEKKKEAASNVGVYMDQHEKGQNLMEKADPKHLN